MKKRWHISYNAPVTLTFAIFCALVLLFDRFLGHHLVPALFTASGAPFDYHDPLNFLRLFTHVFGHADVNHLLGNFAFILLLGPLMEERYGSPMLALMMAVTALVTGVINACLIPSGLLGASGIVFMLIVLASLSTIEKGEIPVSFILVLALYFGREFMNAGAQKEHNVATIAHITGGLCGSLFGFLIAPKRRTAKKAESTSQKSEKPLYGSDEYKAQNNYEKLRERLRARQEKLRQNDENSPRYGKPVARTPYDAVPTKGPTEDDSTVIGTLSL